MWSGCHMTICSVRHAAMSDQRASELCVCVSRQVRNPSHASLHLPPPLIGRLAVTLRPCTTSRLTESTGTPACNTHIFPTHPVRMCEPYHYDN